MACGLILSLALTLAPALPAADWPQWRGPNRDGHAPDAQLPAKWPAAPPAPKWTADRRPRLLRCRRRRRQGVRPRPATTRPNERCLCLDAAHRQATLGDRVRRARSTPPTRPPATARTPRPTVDRDRVYFFGLGGMLTAPSSPPGRCSGSTTA